MSTPSQAAPGTPGLLLRRGLAGLLAAVLVALFAGLYFTRGGDPSLDYNAPPPQMPNTAGLVDQGPLTSARNLAAQAGTRQEQEYARQAMELADREVDQAFAAALREATANPPPLAGPALKVAQRLAALAPQIALEEQQVAAAGKAPSASNALPTPVQSEADARLELAEAQLTLDQDERDDLQQDLVRLGGDRKAHIQQALDEHEALQKQSASLPQNTAAAALESPQGLRTIQGKLAAWRSLEQRLTMLAHARQDAQAIAARLSQKHDQLEKTTAAGLLTHPAPALAGSAAAAIPGASAGTLLQLRALADQRKTLAQLDQRIHEEQQLAEVYQKWQEQVTLGRRTVMRRLLTLAIFLVVLVALMVAGSTVLRTELERRIPERRRRDHLRVILNTALQGLGFAVILLALFGPPQQLSAIIGLATAGIAFVMKDFVVAFFGWFVLMGRGGLRLGDWAEIQGVGGEVVELTLMRTVLLETTSGTDVGHPTGRRVAFMNSYAIEGRFFNFSTAGQWLWDELVINVAQAEDAPAIAEQIRRAIEEETGASAAIAEQEWRQIKTFSGFPATSAAPALSLRPAAAGIDVIVHYVTRASTRYEMRTHLYSRAIEILHFPGKRSEVDAAEQAGTPA